MKPNPTTGLKKITLKHSFNKMDFDRITQMLKDVCWSPGAGNSALLVGAFNADKKRKTTQICANRVAL